MKRPTITRLIEFQRLLSRFSNIERVIHRRRGDEYIKENDTEHSYNLAMSAWYLAQYFEHIDRDKVMRFALIHDLVEIHAGDTYIYGKPAELASKKAREAAALKQLEKDWPDFPDLLEHIHEYEAKSSDEAKFVYALDKIMPIMQIYLSEGYTWHQEGITHERLHEAKRHKVALSPEITDYYEELHELLLKNNHFFGKPPASYNKH